MPRKIFHGFRNVALFHVVISAFTLLLILLALNLVENLLWLTKAFFSRENGESVSRSTPLYVRALLLLFQDWYRRASLRTKF